MPPSVVPVRLRCDRWSLELSPCVVRLDPSDALEVEFGSPDGDLTVQFVGGNSPFEEVSFASEPGAPTRTGSLRSGLTAGERFPYDLTLHASIGIDVRVRGVLLIAPGVTSQPILVRILRNADGSLRVDTDPVRANRKKDERIEWTCDFGSFGIQFDKGDGSPFEEDGYAGSKGGRKRSGRWKAGTLRSSYDYSVYVWLDDATEPLVLDPGVIVDDSGGDDGLSGGA